MTTAEFTATPKTRIERARALVAVGGVERLAGGEEYAISGRTGAYTACLEAETCTCPAGLKGVACYHLLAVEIFEAAARRAAVTTTVKVHRPLTAEERAARLAALERMAV